MATRTITHPDDFTLCFDDGDRICICGAKVECCQNDCCSCCDDRGARCSWAATVTIRSRRYDEEGETARVCLNCAKEMIEDGDAELDVVCDACGSGRREVADLARGLRIQDPICCE